MTEKEDLAQQEFLHTIGAAVIVPFLQSATCGLLIGIVLLFVLLKSRVEIWDSLFYALIAWGVVTLIGFIALQFHWLSLTNIERVLNTDLDGNGEIGPTVTEHTVKIHVHKPNGVTTVARLKLADEVMHELATRLLAGVPFSETQWTGRGKLLSKSKFLEIREEMELRGLIVLRNAKAPTQGYVLTEEGRQTMQEIVDAPAPAENRS